jgi:hypothetical protein
MEKSFCVCGGSCIDANEPWGRKKFRFGKINLQLQIFHGKNDNNHLIKTDKHDMHIRFCWGSGKITYPIFLLWIR